MATLDVILAPGFPHATPRGFKLGCRGSVCSGREEVGWSCAEASVRYAGDFTYRRRVDSGLSPKEIAELDAADRASAAAREREAREAERDRVAHEKWLAKKGVNERAAQAREAKARKRAATLATIATAGATEEAVDEQPQTVVEPVRRAPTPRGPAVHPYRYWTPDEDATVRFLNSLGLLDTEIGRVIGRNSVSVGHRRLHVLHLPHNRKGKRNADERREG